MRRICIYPKDIARITGKSYRQSLRIYNTIKKIRGKQSHQLLSTEEVCEYLGLDKEQKKR
ncbi:hypothetical protein SAMN05421747_10292 [Parapedobacter composti]|uniref:Uncharacterized protein n=2 Tax=Parapedobacter TaxID=416949 RepID=A0A1T5BV38_9SPHI|nr:hypothetical protein SAMN05421747_10292 [Parapedobacter composti]SKB50949.1 hypothetical protein SAMN05660226_01769 [Parapedobacter luteus]